MFPKIAFHLIYIEIDFIIDIVKAWLESHPDENCVFTVRSVPEAERIVGRFPWLAQKGEFVLRSQFSCNSHPSVKFWLTTEQGGAPVYGIPSYSSFHGQPAKGQTLTPATDKGYAGYFLYGPLQRQAIESYYMHHYGKLPKTPILISAGYPRTDALINGSYDREEILRANGLDLSLKTIIYAPAFNEGASLRECGKEIVAKLVSLGNYNIFVKLSVDNFEKFTDFRMNGGINWFEELKGFEHCKRVKIVRATDVMPYIAASDIMLTDVSSVGLDFLITGKPVIYFDSPRFYREHLKLFFPHEDTASWENITYINGGREFGQVVRKVEELPDVVARASEDGFSQQRMDEMRKLLLYHPGNATQFMIKRIDSLLEKNIRETRPKKEKAYMRAFNPGFGFINAEQTENDAREEGVDLNTWLEMNEDTPKKIGHRDRIVKAMDDRGLLLPKSTMLEIGAGTGRFTEKILEFRPARYEIYETASDWVESLNRRFVGEGSPVALMPANGHSLQFTPSGSCDLVMAHAVFVAMSFINFSEYLMEMSRVCKVGGKACFDVFYDADWSLAVARAWQTNNLVFPNVLSRNLVERMYTDLGFTLEDEFTEIYGASFSRYLILRKIKNFK